LPTASGPKAKDMPEYAVMVRFPDVDETEIWKMGAVDVEQIEAIFRECFPDLKIEWIKERISKSK
jgi:hypothetical protein